MIKYEYEDGEAMEAADVVKAYCAERCCGICLFFDEGEEVCKIGTEPRRWEDIKNEQQA